MNCVSGKAQLRIRRSSVPTRTMCTRASYLCSEFNIIYRKVNEIEETLRSAEVFAYDEIIISLLPSASFCLLLLLCGGVLEKLLVPVEDTATSLMSRLMLPKNCSSGKLISLTFSRCRNVPTPHRENHPSQEQKKVAKGHLRLRNVSPTGHTWIYFNFFDR